MNEYDWLTSADPSEMFDHHRERAQRGPRDVLFRRLVHGHTSPRAAERYRPPATAAGETLNLENRHAAAVRCSASLGRVRQNRDEVTRGTRDNEQVPHKVKIPDPVCHEKHRSSRVSDAACN